MQLYKNDMIFSKEQSAIELLFKESGNLIDV